MCQYGKINLKTLKRDYTVNMNSDGQIVAASKTFHFIGKKQEIIQAGRVVMSVGDRDVLVLYHQGDFYAIDVRCYHAGGPLHKGDIEEFDGRSCIVCPWHNYKITLAEGEGLYQAVDPSVKPLKPTWCSKGVKQRVHTVTESNGDLLLTLNDSPRAIDSDHYQTEKYRDTFMKERTKKENDFIEGDMR